MLVSTECNQVETVYRIRFLIFIIFIKKSRKIIFKKEKTVYGSNIIAIIKKIANHRFLITIQDN